MSVELTERTVGVVTPEILFAEDGLSFVRGMMNGRHPTSPYASTMGFEIVEAEFGSVVFTGRPSEHYLNPIGVIHGGWTATILDSAMAHAAQTTLKPGEGLTTLEMKIGYARPVTPATGVVRCEAKIVHRGSRVAMTEARLIDGNGKLLAHGTESCLIFSAPRAEA